MNKRTLMAALLFFAAVGPTQTLAEGDAAAGKAASATCAACHGADGKAILPEYPNLAGQHASYIAKQLTDYRDGNRQNALMSPMAAALTDQAILDLAAYYSSMPEISGVASEDNLELGQNLFRGGVTSAGIASCTGCHGPAGAGNPAAAYPSLVGQNKAYMIAQLKMFRSGERNNDPNEMMRALAHRLSDAEIDALANYASGLH